MLQSCGSSTVRQPLSLRSTVSPPATSVLENFQDASKSSCVRWAYTERPNRENKIDKYNCRFMKLVDIISIRCCPQHCLNIPGKLFLTNTYFFSFFFSLFFPPFFALGEIFFLFHLIHLPKQC